MLLQEGAKLSVEITLRSSEGPSLPWSCGIPQACSVMVTMVMTQDKLAAPASLLFCNSLRWQEAIGH